MFFHHENFNFLKWHKFAVLNIVYFTVRTYLNVTGNNLVPEVNPCPATPGYVRF